MFVTCNRIPVNPDYAAAFEERFGSRAGQVDQMPGFVSFHLLKPKNPTDPYVVMTFWESEAHFTAWTDSAAFREGHGRSGSLPPGTFAGRPTLEQFDVVEPSASP
jgi:heme-degrading monooxygenase HmoA